MKLGIDNKVALVTGGVQGIGSSISLNLLNEGAKVIATSRSEKAIDDFLSKHTSFKEKLICINTSLIDSDSLTNLITDIHSRDMNVDILVNNAGHTVNITDPFCSIEDWKKVFRLNFEVAVVYPI